MRVEELIQKLRNDNGQIRLDRRLHVHVDFDYFDNGWVIVEILLNHVVKGINNRLKIVSERVVILSSQGIKKNQLKLHVLSFAQYAFKSLVDEGFNVTFLSYDGNEF